jgi:hypothetical protein
VPALKALGVADVFGPGRSLDDLAAWVLPLPANGAEGTGFTESR